LDGAGTVTLDDDGNPTGAIGCCMDITAQVEQRVAVEAAAEAARQLAERERVDRERLEFLVAVNDALADAPGEKDVIDAFLQAAVPRLGDWCLVYLVDGPGDLRPRVVSHHVDPDMVSWLDSLRERYPYDPEAPNGIGYVIRTGLPEFHPEITDDVIDDLLVRAGHEGDVAAELRVVLSRLHLRSAMVVPLIKRGRILGGITFAIASDRRLYTTDDLDLARIVAGRVAASVENRRLSDRQRAIARTLQRSLLPSHLPEIDGLDVAVRYWAAGEGIEVGGDFYDVFEISPGRWAAVIGDVCGKGAEAAALTGLARHSIRQAAWHGDDAPTVFAWLNRAVAAANTTPPSFLTAVFILLSPGSHGVDAQVTVAGHPLPVLVPMDGPARTVGTPGQLLGLLDDVTTTPATAHLAAGDTLVLYTDGIGDLQDPHGLSPDETAELIASAVRQASTADGAADAIHGAIAARLPIEDRPDDIALVVLRGTR
jgi:serine phosphatase RsbU (regulator of sigma subunit)